ncbi:type IV secretion system protein VirB7 [Bartonella machadoae]|uniref:type IV secretion system protein VirB7 n=1 Tax=Bartonella machadoae TaxID=2893471 RepID=UPI001F4C73DC|nr:type IV secretion system protein VirB7 [Bartonella machadoae]UNE53780.1 type IV secretion system protein VirB7 [Bartonella machadoae]
MKRKITFFVILTMTLTGCASLSGSKKPPRCNGKQTRVLNRDKWDWDDTNRQQGKMVKPITTPIILNTLESEQATADVTLQQASFNPLNHETHFDKTVEDTREK